MKFFTFVLILIGSSLTLPSDSLAQKPPKIKTEEVSVSGVCDMCKKRIEKAALIKGVKLASWEKKTQTLKVIYRPKKVSLDNILQAVADTGHDSAVMKAKSEAYDLLPGCCKYRDGVEVH